MCFRAPFNEDRTEAGEGGDYKIGVKETVERIYEPLETALQHAVGLKKIYVLVSQTTASASEMVINGLRGLDIEVNLIGQTTNGKNVGMEGVMRSFYNHEFLLYPVTFYVENAKGFRDYSTGFVPDVEIDDSAPSCVPGRTSSVPFFLCCRGVRTGRLCSIYLGL